MTNVPRFLLLLLAVGTAASGQGFSKCDVNRSGDVTVADAQAVFSEALGAAPATHDLNHDLAVNVLDVQIVINATLGLGCPGEPVPSIIDFNPKTGAAGTLVTLTGASLLLESGTAVSVLLGAINGGTLLAPTNSATSTSLTFTVPAGANSGPVTLKGLSGKATSAASFVVTPATSYGLSAIPASANVIVGQTVAYTVKLSSGDGFGQLAQLAVSGLPAGVVSAFSPAQLPVGQQSVLTIGVPAGQTTGSSTLTVSATATVDGIPVSRSTSVTLNILPITTSFTGRTVVSDNSETSLPNVKVTMLGTDGSGHSTPCSGSTFSDASGNFLLNNLPAGCTGPQLIGFDGTTVGALGKYAGVNLVFTLTLGAVTTSPVLVHLPRIDNVETFFVQQNSSVDQTYSYSSVPGLTLTVYRGTTLSLQDGSKPDPFPLVGVQVPVDRLPDYKPPVPTMVSAFIVAFQPANATASQPVAVFYPNTLQTLPGTPMPLMTLDPTRGAMVPYGSGVVSDDGTQIVPDLDPAHPGQRYGIVHFDWHGPMPPPENDKNPSQAGRGRGSKCGCAVSGDPVDLASGIQIIKHTDLAISGGRGSLELTRLYRTLSSTPGPFGYGSSHLYNYQLTSGTNASTAFAIAVINPDGSYSWFSRSSLSGTLTNNYTPSLLGAAMTIAPDGSSISLRYKDGTIYGFAPIGRFLSNLTSITDPNGNTTSMTLDDSGRLTAITDPVGRSIQLAYDSDNRITQAVDPTGRQVKYTYNSLGTLESVTDPAGGVTTFTYQLSGFHMASILTMTNARGDIEFSNTYADFWGRVSQQVRADGGVYRYIWTSAGCSYDPFKPLPPEWYLWEPSWCSSDTGPFDFSAWVNDPLGRTARYHFDQFGYALDFRDAIEQYKVIDRQYPGLPLQYWGPAQCAICGPPGAGNLTYTYDDRGNPLTETDALGNTTTYTYDPVFNKLASALDAAGNTTTLAYDGVGNLTSVTDARGNKTTITYDQYGQPVTVTDPLGNKTTTTYDDNGNPISVRDAVGNVTTTSFDALSRPVVMTDPLGRRIRITYDVLDRITSVTNAKRETTSFQYDAVDNLLKVTDPRNNSTTFTYDAMGRQLTRTNPLGQVEAFQYDLVGNLIQYTDRRGQASSFAYDELDRLVQETYSDATVKRGYDARSRLIRVDDSQGGTFSYAYDEAGRLISTVSPTGGVNYTLDPLGRIAARTVTGQATETYSYDPVGNLLSAVMPQASVTFTYDNRNLLTALTRSNGIVSASTYDAIGRVMAIRHSKGGATLSIQTYQYNAAGDRISQTSDLAQGLTTTAASSTVDSANRLLTRAGTMYAYDQSGNVTGKAKTTGSDTYVWDGRSRLRSVTDSAGKTTTFTYDFGRNLIRTASSDGSGQSFVLDSATNVAGISSGGQTTSILTADWLDSHLASVNSAGQSTFAIADALGSTVGVSDATGQVVGKVAYEPFGQSTASGPGFPFGYTGRVQLTPELYYYRARFYDPTAGRFLSEDPTEEGSGSSNLYTYAAGDPLSLTDPLGTNPIVDFFRGLAIDAPGGAATMAVVVARQKVENQRLNAILDEDMLAQNAAEKNLQKLAEVQQKKEQIDQLVKEVKTLDKWGKWGTATFKRGKDFPDANIFSKIWSVIQTWRTMPPTSCKGGN